MRIQYTFCSNFPHTLRKNHECASFLLKVYTLFSIAYLFRCLYNNKMRLRSVLTLFDVGLSVLKNCVSNMLSLKVTAACNSDFQRKFASNLFRFSFPVKKHLLVLFIIFAIKRLRKAVFVHFYKNPNRCKINDLCDDNSAKSKFLS